MTIPTVLSALRRHFIVALLLVLPALSHGLFAQAAGEVSRTPPAAYAERAEALLTPLAEILAAPDPGDPNATAQILIDESVHLVAEDGRVLRVRQVAYRALTEASLKSLGEDVFSYGRDRERFHLVRAVAIQPDGTQQAVAPDAVLVQSPQRQADMAIYDDTTEVRVIYPRIPVGGATHAITVTEETEARLPGAYTTRRAWGAGWPTAKERFVTELPSSLAARLRWFTLGADAIEPVRQTLPDSTVRFEWTRNGIAARKWEVSRAPTIQTGPSVHLSTLGDWDEVAAWFQSLLDGRDELPADLAAQADAWIASAPDRDAVLRVLFTKVADDIRYTSLALNEGDYRPQTCAEVWDRRHGDCKDKSNLLVALLRRAGISAHVALINTSHLGLVDRRVPDYRVFDHAIVAIEDGQGGYLFCDPTSASGSPGIFAPSVADRDVLVVRDGRADWRRTPAQSAGRLDYAFDLTLNPAGELSGWLTMTADGIYGVWERERYRNRDDHSRRDALARIVRGFFAGADVIDIVPPDPATAPGPAVARAYFVVSAQTDATTGPTSLNFPQSSALFLDLGTTESRETAYFLYRDEIRVSTTINLPPGTEAGVPPAGFQLETPAALVNAGWRVDPGRALADLRFDIRQSSLSPREFSRFYQTMLALGSWMSQPLALRANATPHASAPDATATPTIDLPLMPTGRGQLELIAKRYPYSGDIALRRAALQRALQYFPNDPATAYEAGVHLAVLDWREDRNQEAHDRVTTLLAAHRSVVSRDFAAWGESIQGFALRDLGRTDEAIACFSRIAKDTAVGNWRRSLDALNAIDLLSDRDPSAALQLAKECGLLVSEKQPALLSHLARLSLDLSPDTDLREYLASVARAQPAELEQFLATITETALAWEGDDVGAKRERWAAIVAELAPSPGEELREALDQFTAAAARLAAAKDIQSRLRAAVAQPPLSEWFAAAPAAPESWDAYAATRTRLVDKNESAAAVLLGVRALVSLPAGEDTLNRIWRVAADADWHERRQANPVEYPALALLLALCDGVPKPHDSYYEGRFVRAAGLARRGERSAERAMFEELFADPQFPSAFHQTGRARLGLSCEHLGDYAAALKAYRELEAGVADYDRNADAVLRAVFINLHEGRTDEALRLIGVLENASEATLLKTTNEYFIREFITLKRSGRAEEFWAGHRGWWTDWEALAARLALPAPARETVIPVIPEVPVLKRNLENAIKDRDMAAYWTEFRTLVSAARWLPSLAPEVSSVQFQTTRQVPEETDALRRLVLAQLAVPGVSENELRERCFHLAATLYDSGDHAGVLTAAEKHLAEWPLDEPWRIGVARLQALSALAAERNRDEAAVELDRLLADPEFDDMRPYTVELLANLHRARRLADDERRLLERELRNPRVIADERAHGILSKRFDQLGGSLRLAEHVRDWLRTHPIPWYDYAEPASLDDPRLRDLTGVLENPERQFNHVETIKLRLLAAQNSDIGLAAQNNALLEAIKALYGMAQTHEEAARVADGFIDDERFDEAVRTGFLWYVLFDSYVGGQKDAFERWRTHPLSARYNPVQADFVPVMTRFLTLDATDAAGVAALADEFRVKSIGLAENSVIEEAVILLLRLDERERARALIDTVPTWRFASNYAGSHASTRLRLMRLLRQAEELAPVHQALLAYVNQHFTEMPDTPPAVLSSLRAVPGSLPDISDADGRAAGLWMIKTGRFRRDDFEFWSKFIRAINHDPALSQHGLELVRLALQAAPNDEVRVAAIMAFYDTMDLDDPEVLVWHRATFGPYTDPVAHPQSARALRMFNVKLALRHGELENFETATRAMDAEYDGMRTIMGIHLYIQRGDNVALKRLLKGTNENLLLSPHLLSVTVRAFQQAGMTDEHLLARELAEKELRRAILDAWAVPTPSALDHALDLAEMFGRPDAFPAGWVDSVTTRCVQPMAVSRVRITDAWLRSDWLAVANEARAVLREYPTYHRFQWYLGAALHRAGKIDEARVHLETYVRYAKDEIEHPAALALLASEGGSATPGTVELTAPAAP